MPLAPAPSSNGNLGKLSGPLLDRIDLHIEVPAVAYKELRAVPIMNSPRAKAYLYQVTRHQLQTMTARD